MANIIYLSVKDSVPATGYWDHALLKDLLKDIGDSDRTVIVIPGKNQCDEASVAKINKEISHYKKILVFIVSDEQGNFNVEDLDHPDKIVYSQCGNGGFMVPLGYTLETRKILKEIGLPTKEMDWFFAGQITHSRRELMAEQLRKMDNGNLIETKGFTLGLSQQDYLEQMSEARVVPCPSGAVSVDSFRLYEALEAGCVPIADSISPLKSSNDHYWVKMFGDLGFPTIANYDELPNLIKKSATWHNFGNKASAWWINKKHQFREQFKRDLGIAKEEIVAVVPVSPIKSHPKTHILEETIASIRTHLDCPILLTFDGVRSEQKDKEADYHEFMRRMIWKCNFEYKDVLPIIFDKHNHQSGMMRTVLNNTDIPMILYVEQDTPLTPDVSIDWEKCKKDIKSGKANIIRFHFEASIPMVHNYLMVGEPEDGLQKTVQWSQRPHLASREIYKIIMGLFSDDSNCFIEDYMHGVIQSIWDEQGIKGWDKYKLFIYHPDGSIKRSYNLDGREGEKKFVEEQKW